MNSQPSLQLCIVLLCPLDLKPVSVSGFKMIQHPNTWWLKLMERHREHKTENMRGNMGKGKTDSLWKSVLLALCHVSILYHLPVCHLTLMCHRAWTDLTNMSPSLVTPGPSAPLSPSAPSECQAVLYSLWKGTKDRWGLRWIMVGEPR